MILDERLAEQGRIKQIDAFVAELERHAGQGELLLNEALKYDIVDEPDALTSYLEAVKDCGRLLRTSLDKLGSASMSGNLYAQEGKGRVQYDKAQSVLDELEVLQTSCREHLEILREWNAEINNLEEQAQEAVADSMKLLEQYRQPQPFISVKDDLAKCQSLLGCLKHLTEILANKNTTIQATQWASKKHIDGLEKISSSVRDVAQELHVGLSWF